MCGKRKFDEKTSVKEVVVAQAASVADSKEGLGGDTHIHTQKRGNVRGMHVT